MHRLACMLSAVGRTLTATATIGILLIVAAVIGPVAAAGWHPYIVYTGSMEPSIHVGSIIMVQPTPFERLAPGDVITFSRPQDPGLPVTHRVVKVEQVLDTGAWQITTKGDANPEPDIWTVAANQVVGKMVYALPVAGYVLVWLAAPIGKELLLGFIAVVFVANLMGGRLRRAPAPLASAQAQA